MRGDKPELEQSNPEIQIVVARPKGIVAANIIDPTTGAVQFHLVSTKWFNIMIVGGITTLIAVIIILAIILYVKQDVDRNREELKQIQLEVPTPSPRETL